MKPLDLIEGRVRNALRSLVVETRNNPAWSGKLEHEVSASGDTVTVKLVKASKAAASTTPKQVEVVAPLPEDDEGADEAAE